MRPGLFPNPRHPPHKPPSSPSPKFRSWLQSGSFGANCRRHLLRFFVFTQRPFPDLKSLQLKSAAPSGAVSCGRTWACTLSRGCVWGGGAILGLRTDQDRRGLPVWPLPWLLAGSLHCALACRTRSPPWTTRAQTGRSVRRFCIARVTVSYTGNARRFEDMYIFYNVFTSES